MNTQFLRKAANSLQLLHAFREPKTLSEALERAQKERHDLISLIGRILPRELVLSMFVESGFSVASEWTTLLPEYVPDLQRVAFEYLETVSLSRTRNLPAIRQAFRLAKDYISGLEDPVTKADACAVLFLAAGSKLLGPRVLKYVYEQRVEHRDICTALVKRAKLPGSFLGFEDNVLHDIKIKTPALISIGLYRIAYPLIALSETRFGYALYSSLFNEMLYYAVAADGRPEFCPQGRIRASACQNFFTGLDSHNDVFDVLLKQKLTEIEDALVFVWHGPTNLPEWAKIDRIVKDTCGVPLRSAPAVHDLTKRIIDAGPDYLYALLSLAWKCGQTFTLAQLRLSNLPSPFFAEQLGRLVEDQHNLLVDHTFSCLGYSPEHTQVVLDLLKNNTTAEMLRPLAPLMFLEGQDMVTFTFTQHLLKNNVQDCASEAGRVLDSLYESHQTIFKRLGLHQFNLITRIANVSEPLSQALTRRILHELEGNLLEDPEIRQTFDSSLSQSSAAAKAVLKAIRSKEALTTSPHIWRLVDRLPSISIEIKTLYHQ